MKKFQKSVSFFVLLLLNFSSFAQTTINYTVDNTSTFANPERGWALQFTPKCCDSLAGGISYGPHSPVPLSYLQQLRASSDVMSVYYDVVKIQQYNSDIPQSRLNEIQADLNMARQAGMKVNFRICYNYGIHFGEASYYWIDRHLNQLGPIIQNNADIIMAVDAGMFGGSGEGCCNSAFIDESTFYWGKLTTHGKELYNKLYSFIPASRFMLMRYPRWKYAMMGWENGNNFPTNAQPVTAATAFNGSQQARLGFYDDNFAGDINHYGFFNSWEEPERQFTEADSKYTLMRGELSASTDFNKENGATEMAKYHFTTFHALGNYETGSVLVGYDGWAETAPYWAQTGQYDQMTKKLGYRFSLISATLPSGSFSPGAAFNLTINMTNSGWSGIVNPRNFEIVFRNTTTNAVYRKAYDGDGKGNRMFLPRDSETKTLNVNTTIPNNIANGTYAVFLHLADPYPSIHDRPEYSIRLANTGIWEPATGFNKLNHSITIINGIADVTAPTAPIRLAYSNISSNGFTLSWDASIDNVGVVSYDVYIGGVLKGNTAGTSITLTGLTAGADYLMSVRAKDAVNNTSNPSAILKISTLSKNIANIPQAGTATAYRWSANTGALSGNNKYAAPGINDGNLQTSVELNTSFWDAENAYEAAGVIWSVAQTNINKVSFINGDLNQYGFGNFTANLSTQYTTNGTTWQESGWTVSPSYSYNNSAAGSIYTFSGTIIPSCTGLRVTGRVNTPNSDSYEASVKELLVYFATAPTAYRWSANSGATSNSNRVAAPGINDGNLQTSVELNTSWWDANNAYEAGGIVWPVAQQNISRVDFINGSLNQYGNGNFTTNLSLQFSTNGSTWTASGWPITPSYPYNNSAANNTYTFTGTPVANIKGVRVVGRVRTTGSDSYEASLKEVIVYYSGDIGSQRMASNIGSYADIADVTKSALTLEVYPNPAYHTLTVYTNDSKAQIVISAMNGEIVRQVRGTNTITLIDIRTLPAGVYSVTVQNSKQNRLSKKVIISR